MSQKAHFDGKSDESEKVYLHYIATNDGIYHTWPGAIPLYAQCKDVQVKHINGDTVMTFLMKADVPHYTKDRLALATYFDTPKNGTVLGVIGLYGTGKYLTDSPIFAGDAES